MNGCLYSIIFLFLLFIGMGEQTFIKAKLTKKVDLMSREEMAKLIGILADSNEYLHKLVKKFQKEAGYPEQERLAIKDELLIIKHKIYGASSERRPRRHFRDTKPTEEPKGPKVLLPSERYPHLGVIESEIDFENTPCCKLCDATMEDMKLTENSEYITVILKTYHVVKQKRKKYRCPKCHGDIKTASSPPRLKPGSSFGDDIAIDVAISKYCDHLPIERYVRQAERRGLDGVQPQSLISQSHYLANAFLPIYRELKREVQNSEVLNADETPWKLLEGSDRKNWFLWGFFSQKSSYYEPHNTRATEVAANFLKDCKAEFLMSDAYSGYGRCTKGTNVKNAYCLAHARRKWIEAEPNYPQATPVIEWIGEIYGIEREIKKLEPADRLTERQARSKPIFSKIRKYLFEMDVFPKSSVGKARKYMLKFWDGLTLFLSDGRLSADNNLAERQLRGPVLGRKNFSGNHSIRGANTMAVLYSVVQSCKMNNVEPYQYMKDTLRDILTAQPFYTPSKYAENFMKNG